MILNQFMWFGQCRSWTGSCDRKPVHVIRTMWS